METIDEPKAKIKDFTPTRNDALADIELSDNQIADKKELKELKAAEQPAEELQKPVDTTEEDHMIPEREGFDPDAPLDIAAPSKPQIDRESKKEGNAAMRKQIEEANRRAKEVSSDYDGMKDVNATLQKELDNLKESLSEANKKLTFKDPSEHPDVKALVKPWDDDLDALVKEMSLSGSNGNKLKADAPMLVQYFQELGEVGSPGYDGRKDELMDIIDENYPDDKREVIRIINRGASVMNDATSLMGEISNNGSEYQDSQAIEVYDTMSKAYSDLEKGFFNPSSELRESSPYAHSVIHQDYMEQSEQLKDRALQTKAYMRRAFLPLPPAGRNELSGMSDAEAAQYKNKRAVAHRADQMKIRDMATPAFFSHALLPYVQSQLDKALREIQDLRGASPSLSGDDGELGEKPEETVDIKEFNPGRSNLKF